MHDRQAVTDAPTRGVRRRESPRRAGLAEPDGAPDTYLSLFSGIGGLDLAAERLGFECVGQVEWDRHCSAVLERWWPGVPRWGDITDFDGGGLAPVLIVGGFPCQPASIAGRRAGTGDDRWLWPQFARVVGELRPRLVIVENVPGLTTVNGGRAFSEVLGTLADLGYDATWRSVRASDVGAPHRRQRIFILANRQNVEREWSGDAANPAADGRRSPPGGAVGSGLTDRMVGTPGGSLQGRPGPLDEPGPLERPERPDRFPWGAYEPAIRRWEAVMGPAPHPVDAKGRLAPPFVEWLMGFPPGWTDRMTRTQALKALGNAVVWQQAVHALDPERLFA